MAIGAKRPPARRRASGRREPRHVEPKPSLAAEAFRAVEDMIVRLELPPGSTWSEPMLANRIGIGRTPVREALQRLAAGHVVTIVQRHGIVIAPIDLRVQLLVNDTRREIERLIVKRATRRALAEDKRALLAIAEQMEKLGTKGDIRGFMHLQFDYKSRLSVLAANPFATVALEPLHILTRRFYFRYHAELEDLPLVTRLHAGLLRGVSSGDEDEAARRLDTLVDYAEQLTKRILDRHG
jgi:DNA-binding GntR family transcriptional regulator